MTFKFSEIEGIDAELAASLDADESIQSALSAYQSAQIEEGVTNRVEVAKVDFKKKMDAMNTKYQTAEERAAALEESFKGVDPEEIEVLKQARDKAPELQATLDAMKEKYTQAELSIKEQSEKLQNMQLSHTINESINAFNTEFPTVSVKPDAVDIIAMLAKDAIKLDPETGEPKVYKDGDILATDKGVATPKDWLNIMRTERPSLFNVPTGSGASGSTNNPGSAKTLTRADFAKLPIAEQATTALTHTITD